MTGEYGFPLIVNDFDTLWWPDSHFTAHFRLIYIRDDIATAVAFSVKYIVVHGWLAISFYPLKIGYYVFCPPTKTRALLLRAQKGLKFTQVVVPKCKVIVHACSEGKPDKEIPNMLLFFIKLMVISILMIHFIILRLIIVTYCCRKIFIRLAMLMCVHPSS